MAGEQGGVVGDMGQALRERKVQLTGIAPRQIGPTAALEEQGVTGYQPVVHEEALTTRRMARRVDEFYLDLAHRDLVAAGVADQVGVGHARDFGDQVGLVILYVHRHRRQLEQISDATDGVTHHVATNVIWVVVSAERPSEFHLVLFEHIQNALGVIGRIDHHGLASSTVADEIDEVDHLLSDRVGRSDVAPGQQLSEVQTIFGHGFTVYPTVSLESQHDAPSNLRPVTIRVVSKATWNNATIAESDDVLLVEFAAYFPLGSVTPGALRDSSQPTSYCHWKGEAKYFDVVVDGQVNEGAAWTYPDLYEEARALTGRVAFWKGVEMVDKPDGDPMMDPKGPLGARTGYEALCWLLVHCDQSSLSPQQVADQIGIESSALATTFGHPHVKPFADNYKWRLSSDPEPMLVKG